MASDKQDRYLQNLALRNRQFTARRVQIEHATRQRLYNQTIRNRLHEGDLRAWRPTRGPHLTQQHRARQFEFAQAHLNWRLQDWHTVLFTSESRFLFKSRDGQESDLRAVIFWK